MDYTVLAKGIALGFGLTADGLHSGSGAVTFTDTRADTGDQSQTGTDGAASQSDTFCQNSVIHNLVPPKK